MKNQLQDELTELTFNIKELEDSQHDANKNRFQLAKLYEKELRDSDGDKKNTLKFAAKTLLTQFLIYFVKLLLFCIHQYKSISLSSLLASIFLIIAVIVLFIALLFLLLY